MSTKNKNIERGWLMIIGKLAGLLLLIILIIATAILLPSALVVLLYGVLAETFGWAPQTISLWTGIAIVVSLQLLTGLLTRR